MKILWMFKKNKKHVCLFPQNEALIRAKKFYQFLNSRRSVRHYNKNLIPDINIIIDCIQNF